MGRILPSAASCIEIPEVVEPLREDVGQGKGQQDPIPQLLTILHLLASLQTEPCLHLSAALKTNFLHKNTEMGFLVVVSSKVSYTHSLCIPDDEIQSMVQIKYCRCQCTFNLIYHATILSYIQNFFLFYYGFFTIV